MLTPELVKKMLDAIAADDGKAAIAVLAEVVAAEAAGGAAETADPAKPKPEDEAAKALSALTKKVEELTALTTRVNASALESELTERRTLVADLVKLGIELPGHAWLERAKETDPLTPCKRLSDEPIGALRTRVAELKLARGIQPVRGHEPPESATADEVAAEVKALSAHQLDEIKKRGMTPEQFVAARKTAVRRI